MAIQTRLTEQFNLEWPIISAPMALASGGRLAAEVSRGGGLGLIGGGYGDAKFISHAWQDAGNNNIGIGFITWSLEKQPELLDEALRHSPELVMLSFGNPLSLGRKVKQANIKLMCQCQTIGHVQEALDAGADVIVAQGSEAGGHGGSRATLPFVPEAADLLTKRSPDTLLIAAGGIGDGRALAASLMLGADGVLIGSRYWASREALVGKSFQEAAIKATGDDTMRTKVPDVARKLNWPSEFDIRVLKNSLMLEYHHRLDELGEAELEEIARRYIAAATNGDVDEGGVIVGEITGIIGELPGARDLTVRIGKQAESILSNAPQFVCQ